MSGFNINTYRDANTLKIVALTVGDRKDIAKYSARGRLGTEPPELVKLLLSSPLSFSFGNATSNSFGISGMQNFGQGKVGHFLRSMGPGGIGTAMGTLSRVFGGDGSQATAVGASLGKAIEKLSHLDMTRNVLWEGTSPMTFSVNAFLKTTTNPIEDVLKPLDKLFEYILPGNGTGKSTGVFSEIKGFVNEAKSNWQKEYADKGNAGFADEAFWTLLSGALDVANKCLGEAYLVSDPKQYKSAMFMMSGPFIVGPVVITGCSTNFTNNFYIHNGVSYPDSVQLNLSVETLRSVSWNTPQQPFVIRGI